MTRGPKRKVTNVMRSIVYKRWLLSLKCGHVVWRPIKKRWLGGSVEDPPPGWAYCEECECLSKGGNAK
jgi:hypothetical protein